MNRSLIIMVLLFTAVSCSITEKLHQGEYLLSRNEIKVEQSYINRKRDKVTTSEIESYISTSQTPNPTILGFNFQTRVYNLADSAKNNWLNRTLRNMGNPAIIFDSLENADNLYNISLYLKYRGYFNAEVNNIVDTLSSKKKASVKYFIKPNTPSVYSEINYNVLDKSLTSYIFADTTNSLLKIGAFFDRSILEDERTRIAANLKNNGFFTFTVEDIDYLVDTLRQKNKVALTVNIKRRLFDSQSSDHKQYLIGDIFIDTNHDVLNSADNKILHDTIYYDGVGYISHENKSTVRPKALSRAIMIEKGTLFNVEEIAATNRGIYEMGYFNNANISFTRIDSTDNSDFGDLNCNINLRPNLLHSFNIDAEASSNSNYSGMSLTLGYSNQNAFGGAEVFDVRVTGSYNFLTNSAISASDSYEYGASTSLTFPRMLLDLSNKNGSLNNVKTQVGLSFDRQNRYNYDRTVSTVSYGYNWSENNKFHYSYRPISISLIDVPRIEPSYLDSISTSNPYLERSFDSQIIAGTNFTFGFKDDSHPSHKYNVNAYAETAGNTLYWGYLASKAKKTEVTINKDSGNQVTESFFLFGLPFAQYFRINGDFTYSYEFGDENALVSRIFAGGGLGYGNSNIIPFERYFFAGGSSSMRGWQVRTLGPGNTAEPDSENVTSFPAQVGNIRLEANLEGRFKIYGPMRGAIFLDLGNIWASEKGGQDEAGKFYFDSFYKQLALNTGIGVRLDFSFFVLRFDWGIPLHNPGLPVGERWISEFNFGDTALHFAIGYPF